MMIQRLAFGLLVAASASLASAGMTLSIDQGTASADIVHEGIGQLTIEPIAVDASPIGLTEIPVNVVVKSIIVKISDFASPTLNPYSLTLDFDAPILGVQTSLTNLKDGFAQLGAEADFTPARPAGALESNDTVTFNGNSLNVSGVVGAGGVDPIRVFVEATAVPEFGTLVVWSCTAGIGLVVLGIRRRM